MIQTQEQLISFLEVIDGDTDLVIDTEFRRVSSYYPQLCLLQIATVSTIDCIDILAISDLRALFSKIYRQDSLWIVHSGGQDIEALHHISNSLPKKIFDTQIAASFINYPMQISYQALTKELQNIDLDKAHTMIDWSARPLSKGAVEYALDDVRYLAKNYTKLCILLKNADKFDLAVEESMSMLDEKLYNKPIAEAWKTVKGLSFLNPKEQNIAAQMAAWREHNAQQKNRPRKWILSDKDIIDCTLNKHSLDENKKQELCSFIVKYDDDLQKITINVSSYKKINKDESNKIKQLKKIIELTANNNNLPVWLISNNKSLLKYIRGDRSLSFCQGWRFDILKDQLENIK